MHILIIVIDTAITRPSTGPVSGLRAWICAPDFIRTTDEAPDTMLVSLLDGLPDEHGDRVALIG